MSSSFKRVVVAASNAVFYVLVPLTFLSIFAMLALNLYENVFTSSLHFVSVFFLVYITGFLSVSLLFVIISAFKQTQYLRKYGAVDDQSIVSSPRAPSISIVMPAYNESKTIVEAVRALFNVVYHKFDIIVVNDGSTDNSLELLINAFDLERDPNGYGFNHKIKTKRIISIYRSSKANFSRLMVIDKENGGISDANNAALNLSDSDYLLFIDADTIIEQNALLRLVQPILDKKEKVIIVGGGLMVVNSCIIRDGRLIRINIPKKGLARFQVVDYLRAFFIVRTAWNAVNGLFIISGTSAMYDLEVAIECGGFDVDTVGEDIALTVAMQKYMIDNKCPFKVIYIPYILCWTETPESIQILYHQRNRWTRGMIDLLVMNIDMCFNPKYRVLGMFMYPFWLLYEWFASFVGLFGCVSLGVFSIMGQVDGLFFFKMFFLAIMHSYFISTMAIIYESLAFHHYRDQDKFTLLATVLLEPILYYPVVFFSAVVGNVQYLFSSKRRLWGKMRRTGFWSS